MNEMPFYNSEEFGDGETIDEIWEDASFFKCRFANFVSSGSICLGEFFYCEFENLELSWAAFFGSAFLGCKFRDCVFRDPEFSSCRFFECEFQGCRIEQHGMDGQFNFHGSISYGSTQQNCVNLPENIATP